MICVMLFANSPWPVLDQTLWPNVCNTVVAYSSWLLLHVDGSDNLGRFEECDSGGIARLPGTVVLREVVDNLKTVMWHNFYPAVLVVAGAVMSLHYNSWVGVQ